MLLCRTFPPSPWIRHSALFRKLHYSTLLKISYFPSSMTKCVVFRCCCRRRRPKRNMSITFLEETVPHPCFVLFCFVERSFSHSTDAALSSTVPGPGGRTAETASAAPSRRHRRCRGTPHDGGTSKSRVRVVDMGTGTTGLEASTIATLHPPLRASLARRQRHWQCSACVGWIARGRCGAVGDATYAGSPLVWRGPGSW